MGEKKSPEKTLTLGSTGETARTVGPYHLLQKIGEGGMGEVWVAEQHKPIHRRVALKLIKAGMDTRQVIARFESEKQALAMMDHPAIAKVFDAGETSEGRPYFVMEYVQGIPITAYCDKNHLTTLERLELFKQICEGVQHAHQKAIIHRDLKPSNILVVIQDGIAAPKIIDFGVAKATAQSLTELTMYTELGVLIGTPEYMSPEQAEMTGQNVDTRTDVYSLGAILYELLVGALPFDPRELRRAGFDEIRRRIREVDPPKPSTRLTAMGEASTTQAQNRRTERPALIRQIRGDLDWITMKALEKDRTRRYGSPSELAADIDRYLHHQPIVARPPSTLYKTGKFVRRHRVGVGLAATLAVLLVAFSVTTSVQARRIARERDRANQEAEASRQISDFLTGLFKVSDPSEARGNSITAREILDRGSKNIETELASQPAVQARLMAVIGEVYWGLGLYSQAQALYERSLDTRRKVLKKDDPEILASLNKMGTLFFSQGKYAQAEPYFREALEGRIRVLGRDNPETLRSLNNVGAVLLAQGKTDEAEPYLRATLEARRRVLGEEHTSTLSSMHNLANVLYNQGKLDEAERYFRKALEISLRINGKDHPATLDFQSGVGLTLKQQGRLAEAEPYLRDSLEGRRRVLGENHPSTLAALGWMAELYADQGKLGDAEDYYRKALKGLRSELPPESPDIASVLCGLADVLDQQERYADAEPFVREAWVIHQKAFEPASYEINNDMSILGEALAGQKRFEEAEPLLLKGSSALVESPRTSVRGKRRAIGRVIKLYLDWGKPEKAAVWQAKVPSANKK